MRVVRELTGAGLLMLAFGCETPVRSPEPPPLPSSAATTPAIGPDAAAAVVGSDAGVDELALVRESAPGSTLQTIACGRERCKAGEAVCARRDDGRWHCVPASESTSQNGSVWACDEASDCGSGESCCQSFVHGGVRGLRGAQRQLRGGAVRGGRWCAVPRGARKCRHGACVPPLRSATCTGKKACPAEQPVCVWKQGRGEA
ncbi:MAG: hypothetical protein U0263_41085 [Polyangiaceae bacterium]